MGESRQVELFIILQMMFFFLWKYANINFCEVFVTISWACFSRVRL